MDAQDADQDFSKLNLEDRLTHKNWKARVSGYEELAKQIPLFEDKEFSKISPLVKKFVLDTNTAAQEKGLSAVLPFLDYCPNAGKYVESIVSGTITKCLASTRTRTRELASDVVLMCVEIERQDVVLEELVKGLEQKTPKNVASVIGMIRKCLSLFGNKVISVKPIVPFLAKLLEERDANVREEAKHLTIEVFRWVKDALLPQLSSLKPILLAELNAEFDKIRTVRPTPERLLRSQQQQQRVEENSGNTGDTPDGQLPDDDDDIPEEIDPFELLQPVDIIAKLPNDFYTVAEAKKWQERKDALEKLEQLLEANPKLAPSADHNELLKLLKKIIAKDSNIVVATHAIKCITLLANGLRKNFQNFATSCFGVILDKFKEKKANVVQALREAVDAIYVSTTLEAVVEDLTAALDNKNPSIRSETALFLARAYSKTNPGLINKKLLKTLTTSLLKTLSDSDATVRESSAEALGTALKAQGDRNMAPLLLGLEGLKMAKIEEFKAKVEVKKFAPLPLAPAVVPASAPANVKPKSGFAPKKGGTITRQVKTAGGAPAYTSTESLNNVDNPGKVAEKKPAKFGIAKAGTGGGAPKYGTVKRAGTAAVSSGSRLNSARSSSNLASGVQGGSASGQSGSAPTSSSLSSKKQQSSDECSNHPMMNSNSKQKDQRLADEKALKVLKWNFTSPREEFYQQLREQMSTAEWNPQLVGFCFHSDFKYHIKAIDMIREFLVTAKNNGEFGCLVANIDLILKWIALRFFDTNPSVIMKALELLLIIFRICHSNSYMMNDSEANSFLPYLVLKVGDPKDVVRNKVHDILLIIRQIYPATKLCAHLLGGLQSKNSRQRATCLEEIALLIELKGMAIFQAPNSVQVVKEIARFIGERDNGVRNGALSCIVQVYFLEGEKVFKLVGNLSDKEMSLVEERIKRASKNKPPPPAAASQNSDSNFKTPGDNNSHPNGTGMFQAPGSAQHHPQQQQQPNNNKFYQSQESGRSLPQFRPSSNQFTPPPNQSSENTQCSGQFSQPQSRIQSMSNLRQLASANSDTTSAMDEHNFNGTPQSNTGTFSKTKSASFTKRSFMGGGGGSNQNRFSQQQMSRMAPDKLEFGTDSNGGGDDSGAEFADIESGIMNSDSGSAINNNNQMNYDDAEMASDDYSDLDGKVREALNLPGIKLKLNRNRAAGSNMAITPSPTRFSSSSSGSMSSTSGGGLSGSHQPLNPELNRKFADMFTQLSSSDCTVAFQALEHLNVALKDLPKYQPYLENKVDQLIFLCNKQYRLFLTVHYPESTSGSEGGASSDSEPSSGTESTNAARIKQSELLFRGVTSVLNKLFNCPLGKRASRDTLRELITHLLPYFVEMKEHTNIFNSVNYFFTILLNGSDSTNLIAALIRMLHDSLAQSHAMSSAANTNGTESESSPAKPSPAEESTPLTTTTTNTNHTERFLDITMKFLWRVSKFLDRYIGELNLDVIMFECHLFFKSYPRSFWKLYQNGDLPNRTIKTLIFLIVERKGDSILDNFGLIQNKDESELSYYVQKALRQREQHERQNSSTGTNPSPKTRNNTSALSLGSNISAIDVSSARAGINQENQVHSTTPGSAKSNRPKANETTKCSNLPRPSFEAQHAKMPLRTRQINITSEDGSRKQGSVPIIRTEDDLRCYVEFTARQLDFPELNYDRLKANSTTSTTKVGSLQEAEKVVQACRERLLNFKSHCRNLNPVAKPAESASRTAE